MDSKQKANELFQNGMTALGSDNERAFTCFSAAAEAGHPEAMQRLSECLQYGLGTKENPVLAAVWAGRAKAAGFDPDAANQPKDEQMEEYRAQAAAAREGDEQAIQRCAALEAEILQNAQGILSDAANTPEQLEQAAQRVKALADSGSSQAQWLYAALLESGHGVKQNIISAAKWFRMAAENGNPAAQIQYGMYLQFGHGMEKDPEAARQWYEKAAAQDHPAAYQQLGCLYYWGDEDTAPDYEKAIPLLQKAADQNMPQAMALLGEAYMYGKGVEEDMFAAVDLLEAAANLGHEQADFLLRTLDLR